MHIRIFGEQSEFILPILVTIYFSSKLVSPFFFHFSYKREKERENWVRWKKQFLHFCFHQNKEEANPLSKHEKGFFHSQIRRKKSSPIFGRINPATFVSHSYTRNSNPKEKSFWHPKIRAVLNEGIYCIWTPTYKSLGVILDLKKNYFTLNSRRKCRGDRNWF